MKQSILLIPVFAMFITTFAFGQGKNSPDYVQNLKVYARAMKYNDISAATNALYNLIAMEPRNDTLLTSLARLYFDNQKFISSILVSNDILSINPNNIPALEISALSKESIGAKEKALEDYESLYMKTEDLTTLYKIGFLQYELKRYNEATTTTDILLEKDSIANIPLYFPVEDNSQQEVSMKASVYNLKGLINKEQGKKDEAKKNFQEALALYPEFFLAKENMKTIDE
jgi:tetratricopeptide (TPR) repeat protein